MNGFFQTLRRRAVSLVIGASSFSPAPAAVVISEINYNSPAGAALEFIELRNLDAVAVPLGGWRFNDGVQLIFPDDAVIEANGHVVVAQNRDELIARFSLPAATVYGNFTGALDNGGETVTLVDAAGTIVDQVKYDDDAPWDVDADGAGGSLERICPTFDGDHPANWKADKEHGPTPLAPSSAELCPPPSIPPPVITINEIHYHPVGDRDTLEEFVELRNNGAAAINLKGYAFTQGISFTFEEDVSIEPGGYLVVCRNQAALAGATGITNAVGDFTGQLSNDGERLTLVDAQGAIADSVRYSDSGDWPVTADGLGRSLEKIVAGGYTDDPANWVESGPGDLTQWRHGAVTGVATSSKLTVYLDGPGEFLIDNVRIDDAVTAGQPSFIPNGTFDSSFDPWLARGNHADSRWEPTGGPDGSGALRLIATGVGAGTTNGLSIDAVPELSRVATQTYTLSFDYRYVAGAKGLRFRVSGASPTRGMYWQLGAGAIFTPGAVNTASAERAPPFVSRVNRLPAQPGSTDPVWITARVKTAEGSPSATLSYFVDGTGEPTPVSMADDGQHQDGLAGDGVFGAMIPAQPHNTIITFRIEARDAQARSRLSPPDTDPTGVHGYYVNDLRPESPLPTYTLLLRHNTPTPARTILAGLNCATYQTGSFAVDGDLYFGVGIRQRGQSVCGSTKPFLKVRFQRGRELEGLRKLNLQSLWTDKALVREHLSWAAFDEVGMPSCFQYHIRLHANGKYYGLYAALEHPDARFLERNRLNPEGNLYKATASTEEVTGVYEKKTNENGDSADLQTFLRTMHSTPRPQLVSFFQQNVDADRVIDYQLAQTLTNNSDYPHKNHYLYHDTESGRWMPLTWDMDLTFGKLWDGTYGGVLHDKMHTPGNNPWYTTSVDGGLGNHLLDKFFFQAGDHFRRAYIVRLWDALQEKYTEAYYDERIAFLHDLLFEEQAEDLAVWGRSAPTADDRTAPRDFEPNLDRVKSHVTQRRTYLLNYLRTRHRFTGHDRLKLTEVHYNPIGSGEELEFLELWNPDIARVDASGWTLEGVGYAFPPGTAVEPNEILVLAKDPAAFRARYGEAIRVLGPYDGALDNDGEILRLKDAGPGYPATVDFLRYGNASPWPREADGLGYSMELTLVSPQRDNDLGISWRRSAELGGSPGAIGDLMPGRPSFRRGDPDADAALRITDALVILRHLFQGAPEPACRAAGDMDANGALEVNDAVVLLTYLFRDSTVAIPSPTPTECAPGDVETCKASNCRS